MKVVPSITGAFNIAEKQLETGFKVNFAIKKYGGNIPLYFWLSKSFLENSSYTMLNSCENYYIFKDLKSGKEVKVTPITDDKITLEFKEHFE